MRYYGTSLACQAQSIELIVYPVPGFLDTHPLVSYIPLTTETAASTGKRFFLFFKTCLFCALCWCVGKFSFKGRWHAKVPTHHCSRDRTFFGRVSVGQDKAFPQCGWSIGGVYAPGKRKRQGSGYIHQRNHFGCSQKAVYIHPSKHGSGSRISTPQGRGGSGS